MRRPRRTVLALTAAAVVCGAAAGVIAIVHSSGNPVDTATIVAADLAVAALALAILTPVVTWWVNSRRTTVSTLSQAAAAADRLAAEMTDRWQLEAVRRRIVTPAPVTVRWRWASGMTVRKDVTTAPMPGTRLPPLPCSGRARQVLGSGVVTRLHDEMYARLPHGRLVLLGGPGAGKTAAMLLLMLAALDRRSSLTNGDERGRVPVPVWLTLGGWDPAGITLREWAAERMNLDHPALRAPEYGPDAAGELLRGGRVALFLDGLDEMPQEARAHALKRISAEAAGLRLVLTSRPEQHQSTASSFALDNSAVIELLPVRPAAAGTFLLHGQAGIRREQWSRIVDYLKRNPHSVAAKVLDNPLTLSLARDAYASKDPIALSDPAAFPTQEALREHLIDQALVTAYPDGKHREHAAHWLAWLACQMGTSRDLRWWDIPAWIPRPHLRLARVLGSALIVGLVTALALDITPVITARLGSNSTLGVGAGLEDGLVVGAALGLALGPWLGRSHAPRALALRWPAARDAVVIGLLLTVISLGAPVSGSLTSAFSVITTALTVAAAAFLAFEFRALLSTPTADSPSATAIATYRADRTAGTAVGLAAGAAFGLAVGLGAETASSGFVSFLANKIDAAVPVGCAIAVAAMLLTGQVSRLKFAEAIVSWHHRDRVRFMHLLEEASRLQVLRQAGIVYQFRHAALQDRLAASQLIEDQPQV